jgi:hypothetical protein
MRYLTASLGGLDGPVRCVEVPLDVWRDDELRKQGLPDHVYAHILTMAKLV